MWIGERLSGFTARVENGFAGACGLDTNEVKRLLIDGCGSRYVFGGGLTALDGRYWMRNGGDGPKREGGRDESQSDVVLLRETKKREVFEQRKGDRKRGNSKIVEDVIYKGIYQ